MNKNIFVFVPDTLNKNKTGYLKGCHKKINECEVFYITSDLIFNDYKQSIGYIGRSFKSSKCKSDKCLFINNSNNKILVNNDNYGNYSIVEVIYDFTGFKNSDIISSESDNYGKHFQFLTEELRKCSNDGITNGRKSFMNFIFLVSLFLIDIILKIINAIKPLLLYSATFIHFEENMLNLKWFLSDIGQKKRLSPKTGNILMAKVVDLLIGILLLNWCLKYEDNILNFIQTAVEDIISNLKGLLLYLMGSPIGLKLNHAFNNTLGRFFFYHISLWRVFLHGTHPLLMTYFRYLVLPGTLGFSFQIAMLSDIISIATFHVYCIYVYAARLFSLQIRGLVSLWRLFIGRKSNPLRQRVDSCTYTPDQLFIGTLGFTILLFLLPTTTMYYTVFTTFRLAILFANGLLLRVRFLMNTVPLYMLGLWVFNSSSVAGTVYLNWKNDEEIDRIIVEAKLRVLPLISSVKKFVPDPIKSHEGVSCGYILHSMFTGVLL